VADRHSGAPVASRETAVRRSAGEEIGRNPDPGCRERTLEGTTPGEPPAVDVLNPRPVARDSREDKPRNRGLQGRPPAPVGGSTCGRNGKWASPVWKRTSGLPGGESSEG
jgi:hypothetical protein